MAKNVRRALGQRIRALRIEKALSQEALAEASGLDRTYVSGVERGVRNPSLESLNALASGLQVTLSELLEGVSG